MSQPNSGPETGLEKVLRWGIPLGIFALIFYFWGQVSAFVVETLENTLKAGIYGFILFLILAYIVPNWKFIVRKFTSLLIKMDPLSFMDRYADILTEKLRKVRDGIVHLRAEKVSLEKDKAEATKLKDESLKLGIKAKELGQISQVALYGSRLQGAKEDLSLIEGDLQKINLQLQFMEKLHENWDTSVTAMREFIERKRKQWNRLKRSAAVLKQSEEFLRGDTPEAQIYNESVKSLEEQMSQKFAYIEDFEKRAKPIMEGYDLRKAVRESDGVKAIEDYMNDSSLFLPDFSNFSIEDTQFEILPASKPSTNTNTNFKFLKK